MAAGYLIRDASGQIAGYALEGEGKILVRMHGGEGTACVAACSAGKEVLYEVPYDRKEHAFEWTMGRLEHIAVKHRKEIGKTEENDAQTKENKKEKGNIKTACKKHAHCSVYKRKRVMQRSVSMTRWPPPPCWPTARYVDGVWREGGD